MLAPQPLKNSHVSHVMNSTRTKVDEANSNKSKKSSILGLVVKITYSIVAFIPRKTWNGIKFICNKTQKLAHEYQKSINERRVRIKQAENAAYLEKARVAFPPKVPEFLLESSQLLKYTRGLIQADILQRANDFKGEGKDFSSRVLGSSPSSMKKSIAEADRKAAITDHAKREFQLKKQYDKLICELKSLENQKIELEREIDTLSEKLLVMEVHEDNATAESNEMMRGFRILKVKQDEMRELKAEIKSKAEVLDNVYEAYKMHIGS